MQPLQFRNPFVKKWGEDYRAEELTALFSEFIIPLIPSFFDFPNIFLCGGSGTGKTMLLRYLSFDIQRSYFEKDEGELTSLSEFFEYSADRVKGVLGRKIRYLGIYSRLTDIPASLFKNKCRTKQQEQILFKFYLDLEISIKFISSLAGLIKDYVDVQKKKRIESAILECVKKYSDISKSAEFSDILGYLVNKKNDIDLYLGSLRLDDSVSEHYQESHPSISGLFELFMKLAEILQTQVEEFRGVNIFILLDEYERVEDHLKVVINTIIRRRNEFLKLKISLRRYGLSTTQTLNPNDSIIIGRDALLIDLEYLCRYSRSKYKNLLADVARRRLESEEFFAEKKLTNIRKLLKTITLETEGSNLVKGKRTKLEHRKKFREFLSSYGSEDIEATMSAVKCSENVLVEKLNMLLVKRRVVYQRRRAKGRKLYSNSDISRMAARFMELKTRESEYSRLYEKNKLALLFQLISEYGKYNKRKIYAGFDVFAALSGGFVASFLDLCYETVENIRDKGFRDDSYEIEVDLQRKAAEKVAWDFLDGTVRNLERIGGDIYYFVLNTGAFLRALYLDELLREPEPTYIDTKTARLAKSSRYILETAHYWSVLQSKIPMKPKEAGEPLPDVHILHPILAPAFQISYRTRGRTTLPPQDMDLLISGSEKDVRQLVAKYRDRPLSRDRKHPRQRTLFDL